MITSEVPFAVVTDGKEVVRIGRSTMYMPKINYTGTETKWFDDTKLMKKTKYNAGNENIA